MNIVTALYFFLTAGFIGITLLTGLKLKFSLGLKLISGTLLGAAVLSLIIFWQSWLIPFQATEILLTSSLLTAGCSYWWFKNRKHKWEKINLKQAAGWIPWVSFWLGLFGLIWSRMLKLEESGLYAGWVNVWGDWAAHLTYTTAFALGNNFPPTMPILAGAKFGYPFLADFMSAILIKLSGDLIPMMLAQSFVLSFLLVMMLVFFGRELGKKLSVGKLTTWLFLFNGGLGFWWWIKDVKELGLTAVAQNLPREYTHLEKLANIEWINIITSQVVPQRGFLLGFPLAILVYILLWRYWNLKEKKNLAVAGGITGLLPLIHAHSVAIILAVAGGLAIIEGIISKSIKKTILNWWRFFVPVMLLTLPQIWYFYSSSVRNEGFIQLLPGWLAIKRGDNFIWFWIKNLGLMSGLILWGMKSAGKRLRLFSLPFWVVFAAANIWTFQPWEWDNTKFFVHWYLIGCVLAAGRIDKFLNSKKLRLKILAVVVLEFTLLAGGLDVWRLAQYDQRKIRFFTNEQLNLANWVANNTDPGAMFVTADNHDHWLPTLTGRKTLVGYKGWLWTYGINYSEQEKAVRNILTNDDQAKDMVEKYGVKYLVLGPMERELKINLNEAYFEQNFPVVYQTKTTKIYSVAD